MYRVKRGNCSLILSYGMKILAEISRLERKVASWQYNEDVVEEGLVDGVLGLRWVSV